MSNLINKAPRWILAGSAFALAAQTLYDRHFWRFTTKTVNEITVQFRSKVLDKEDID